MATFRFLRHEKTDDESDEKLAPFLRAIKAVRSNGGMADPTSIESLSKQRQNQELLSKLVTPSITVNYDKSVINARDGRTINIAWATPVYAHRKDKIIMYCHGGGYTCGGLGYAGILAGKLSTHTGLSVITFEYRLAPENPYPAAILDALEVWDYLMYQGYGAKDIILSGDSAGGNLCLELILKLAIENRMLPRAQILMSPWTDMTLSSETYEKNKDIDPMLTYEYVEGVRRAYIEGMSSVRIEDEPCGEENKEESRAAVNPDKNSDSVDYRNPNYSPLFADLSKMPATYIQVGSNEILQDDSVNLYNALKELDVMARLDVYEGGFHVFQQLPTPRANLALKDIAAFVDSVL